MTDTATGETTPPRVEEKLYQNRYLVDTGRPHISVTPHEVPSPVLMTLTKVCPAGCYSVNSRGQVEIVPDGCLECGTCRVLGEPGGEIVWSYPRGGYGILFKFG
jgi:ferredoxin like protein